MSAIDIAKFSPVTLKAKFSQPSPSEASLCYNGQGSVYRELLPATHRTNSLHKVSGLSTCGTEANAVLDAMTAVNYETRSQEDGRHRVKGKTVCWVRKGITGRKDRA